MSLPAPNLDDRRFQDLVDEAKRLVQRNCPEWTDHNVSDPGVTLIETFAMMVDQLIYRLNRVPDLHYLRFLELIGLRLFPPTAARCDVTFWLSAARDAAVTVPAGAEVACVQTEAEEPVVFHTRDDLFIVPCSLSRIMTWSAGAQPFDRTEDLRGGAGVECFAQPPGIGDAVLFGLSAAVPRCAVLLRLDCPVRGVGVRPDDPPLQWEAWTGSEWEPCEVDRDDTGGLNKPGDVVLHVPRSHVVSLIGRHRAGWLRCRTVEPRPKQAYYTNTPGIIGVTAATIGGTIGAEHSDTVEHEVVGLSEGVPGQRFVLQRRPVAATGDLVVEVAGGSDWEQWHEVQTFAASGPGDPHFMVDRVQGEVVFGPATREPDGTLRHYGKVPPKAAPIRVPRYRTGGGKRGNVARDVLRVQRDPVPFVTSVTNRRAGSGGVDGESVADAALRGPLLLRTRDRAVTVDDYEYLAREAAPDVARVKCVPVPDQPGAVRLLVVPKVSEALDPAMAEPQPSDDALARIADYLEERRCLGARVMVEPPYYLGVTVVAQLHAKARTTRDALLSRATEALYGYLNPVVGGPDGTGWPFGRPVQSGEIFAVLQRLPGVDLVEDVQLYEARARTSPDVRPVQRIDLPPHGLVISRGHQIRITEG
jgi:predicted phage baseplate assembly protein